MPFRYLPLSNICHMPQWPDTDISFCSKCEIPASSTKDLMYASKPLDQKMAWRLNQCLHIVNWILGRNISEFDWNRTIFEQDIDLWNVICKMAAMLFLLNLFWYIVYNNISSTTHTLFTTIGTASSIMTLDYTVCSVHINKCVPHFIFCCAFDG